MPSHHSDSPIIRASEIGEYVYCHRAWWLRRVQGVRTRNTAALEQGREAHDRHGRTVAGAVLQQRLAWIVTGLALLLALIAAVILVAGAL